MFKHIGTDERGWNTFDRYFAYIDSAREILPPDVHAFASDVARYELQGQKTLHDAWLEDFSCRNAYEENSNVLLGSTIVLVLRQAYGGVIRLTYGGVSGWTFHGLPERWPDRAVDLLVHEFSMESDCMCAHRIEFDRSVTLEILFRTFSVEEIAP